jgi:hypothetical protein
MIVRLRNRSARLALLAALPVIAAAGAAAWGEATASLTCANDSGYSWRIVIDYRRAMVDSDPATITAGEISWYDPGDGGHYTLERKTGELTASVASSTGGIFRHARCSLEPTR